MLCLIPGATLKIGSQELLCVEKLLSVNTAQRVHDWASSILKQSGNPIGSKARQGLLVEGRKSPSIPVILPKSNPLASQIQTVLSALLPLSVRWLSQVCNPPLYPPNTPTIPNHCLPNQLPPPPFVFSGFARLLMVLSNNICIFHTMTRLKGSLCSKRLEPEPLRGPQVMSWETWSRLALTYFPLSLFLPLLFPVSLSPGIQPSRALTDWRLYKTLWKKHFYVVNLYKLLKTAFPWGQDKNIKTLFCLFGLAAACKNPDKTLFSFAMSCWMISQDNKINFKSSEGDSDLHCGDGTPKKERRFYLFLFFLLTDP